VLLEDAVDDLDSDLFLRSAEQIVDGRAFGVAHGQRLRDERETGDLLETLSKRPGDRLVVLLLGELLEEARFVE
jgi:hypothetical protein